MRKILPNKRGMTLIVSVMLILFVSVTVLSLTTFIVQKLLQAEANSKKAQGLYLAQAGIHKALYDFRFHDIGAPNGYFTLGQVNIDANRFFVIGANSADLLMVNTSGSAFSNNNKDLQGIALQNATNSQTIAIDKMIGTWNTAAKLKKIRIRSANLGGWTTVWNGNLSSGQTADIINYTLDRVPNLHLAEFTFDSTIGITNISIQFVMTDLQVRTVVVYPASPQNNFIVKATGKTTGSNIYRTIQAEYNAVTSKIVDNDEISTQITP